MATFTGNVVQASGDYRFNNDDGTPGQRLTTAEIQGSGTGGASNTEMEIRLRPFAGRQLRVEGDWEHDWIMNVTAIEVTG